MDQGLVDHPDKVGVSIAQVGGVQNDPLVAGHDHQLVDHPDHEVGVQNAGAGHHVEHHPGQVVSETLFQHKVAVGMTHAQVRAEAGHPEGQHLDEVLRVTLGNVVGLTLAQVCAGAGHPVSGHHEGHLNSEVVGVRPAQACAGAGHV